MPVQVTGQDLFGPTEIEAKSNKIKTSAELFGEDVIDDAKVTGDLPNGDTKLDSNPQFTKAYRDILGGDAEYDSFIPEKERVGARNTSPDYEGGAKRTVNSTYFADILGIDVNDAYTNHDDIAQELVGERTPTKAFDRIKNRFNNGVTQVKVMDAGYALLTGKGEGKEGLLAQIKKLQGSLSIDALEDIRGFGEGILGATAEQLPNMWEAMKASPKGAIPGGIVGALVAIGVGNLSPAAATPEEVVTVPAFAWKGVKWGGGVAAANRIRQMEAGGMYLELLDMEDDNGNKIDPTIAKATAHAVGAINGGIELAEWAVILSTFGVGTKVFERAAANVTSKLLAKGTLKHVALKYALKYGGTMTAEIAQEVWQESNNIVFGELAKEINNRQKGTSFKRVTGAELAARYKEITLESAKGFALLIAPGTVISGAKEAVGVQKAKKKGPAVADKRQPVPVVEKGLTPLTTKEGKVVEPAKAEVAVEETGKPQPTTEATTEKAVDAVYKTPEVDEITGPVEDLTKQETADLAQLDALPEGKSEKPSKRKPAVKVREFLTPGSTVDKVVKEYTALKAAMKKAATAARTAFSSGNKEGIAKIKEHYKALKVAEKQRKVLKKRVEKAVKEIKKNPPKTVDFYYRKAIEAIQATIDPSNRTVKTKQKRQRMRDFLTNATPEQRREFPKKLALLLDKKDLSQYTVKELEEVADQIKTLTKLGKVKQKARKSIDKAGHEKLVKKLVDSAGGAPKISDDPKGIDFSPEGISKGVKSAYLWTLRIPRIMDWLDGRKGTFSGLWHKMFYDSVNENTNLELNAIEERHSAGMEKMESLGITMNELSEVDDFSTLQNGLHLSKEQQMGLYVSQKNKLAKDAVVNGNKISLKTANAIISNLDQKYIAMADWIVQDYANHYEQMRQVFIETTGNDLGAEEFYTPMIRLEKSEYATNEEMVDQLLARYNLKQGYVAKNFTIDRKNISAEHQKPIDIRLVSTWQSQTAKHEHFVHFAKITMEMNKILRDPKIKAVLEAKLGKGAHKILKNYVGRVANPEIYKAHDGMALLSRTLRRNVAMGYLAFNLMTMAKQLPSAVLFMKDAGVSAMLSSITEVASDPRGTWNKVRAMDPQVKQASVERELQDLKDIAKNAPDKTTAQKIAKLTAKVGEKGMVGIKFLDGVVRTIGWNAVYTKNKQLGLSDAEAARQAQNATLRTQPASAPKDIAQLYATDEYINWFTMFTNQLNNIWNITTYDTFAYWNNEKYQDAAVTLMAVTLNASIIWMLVNKRLPDDDTDAADMALDQILNILPLINSGAMAGKRGWGAVTPPPIAAVTEITKIHSAKDKEKQAVKALEASLVLAGVPVTAIKRAGKSIGAGDPGELFGGSPRKKGGIKL